MRSLSWSSFLALMYLLACLLPAQAAKLVLVAGGGSGAEGLKTPFGVDFDRAGSLFFVEFTGQRVRKIDAAGILTTIAGTGEEGYAGDGEVATKAKFKSMHSLVLVPNGDIYLADTFNNCVRKIDIRTGRISTFAGTGEKGFSGDGGPATKAKFSGVHCLALGPKKEKLYLADLDNRRIRTVELRTGTVATVAGNGKRGVPEDGAEATKAPLVDPRAVAVDGEGRVYILERGGHALRVVGADGKIRTVAGNGRKGFSGDDGPALKATFNGPKHLCIEGDGNVLIADTENHVIRKYLPREGKIVRVAGTGRKGDKGLGGPPLEAELSQPHGVQVRPDGTIYIADSSNNRILKIEP
ncbi:MAG TPA: hypothetical protein VH575_34635 [Gemmataceae bacterium]|jgi:DNA-binding beta-propeller fold protein YncE